MITITMDTVDALRVVVGIAQMVIGVVAIALVLRGRRRSPQQRDFRGGPGWAVAGWTVFGLLGLVWVARALYH